MGRRLASNGCQSLPRLGLGQLRELAYERFIATIKKCNETIT